MKRNQGITIVVWIVAVITTVLAAVVSWGPNDQCAAQFPKVIGCVLGSYQELSGGLIAAGGALFAGRLVWSTSRAQMAFALRQARANEVAMLIERLEQAESEMRRLVRAKEIAGLLLQKLHEDLHDPAPSATRLSDLWRRQEFPSTPGDWYTPEMGSRLWEGVSRLRTLAGQIESERSHLSAEMQPRALVSREVDAHDAIAAFHALVAEIDMHLEQQQSRIDYARRRVEGQHRRWGRHEAAN